MKNLEDNDDDNGGDNDGDDDDDNDDDDTEAPLGSTQRLVQTRTPRQDFFKMFTCIRENFKNLLQKSVNLFPVEKFYEGSSGPEIRTFRRLRSSSSSSSS